ncbi:hypothetical protein CSAL01_02482 [Colletotrichum salicis]|uniref:Uncharacterized protein n=1 Tax=Colletotrichum salicis TaxID=1209931 RepID=A0A135RYA9_9PEZI|nr:hypothetical protein CSAL01_02482 [Colletotrichum salicis]
MSEVRLTEPADILMGSTRRDYPERGAPRGLAKPVVSAPVAAINDAIAVLVGAAVARTIEAVANARMTAGRDEADGRVEAAHLGVGGALVVASKSAYEAGGKVSLTALAIWPVLVCVGEDALVGAALAVTTAI